MPRLICALGAHIILFIFHVKRTYASVGMTLGFNPSDRFQPEKRKFYLFFLFRLHVAFNNLSNISRLLTGCDRELNAHWKSAASLTYHTSDTWRDMPPNHVILTPDRPIPLSQCRAQTKEQLIPFWKSLVWLGRGSNPQPPGRSGNWVTAPVGLKVIGLLI